MEASADQTIHSRIKSMLSHFGQDDREEAITKLIFIGLHHYHHCYNHEKTDITYLRALCNKYTQQAPSQAALQQPAVPMDGSNLSTTGKARKCRSDAMSHFPFADSVSHVPDVLRMPWSEVPKLLEMGAPARRRLAVRVFEELCFEKHGIRLSDIPEALQRLGIVVSTTLRQILQRTHAEESSAYFTETYVTLAQWESIVKRVIYMIRRGKRPEDIVHLFAADRDRVRSRLRTQTQTRGGQAGDGVHKGNSSSEDVPQQHGEYYDSDYEYNSDDNAEIGGKGGGRWGGGMSGAVRRGEEETKQHSSSRFAHALGGVGSENQSATDSDDFVGECATGEGAAPRGSGASRKQQQHHHHHPQRGGRYLVRTGRYQKRLQQVPSRIGAAVQNDRQRYYTGTAKRDRAAKATLAQRRVDALTSTAVPLGFRDRNYFSEPRLFHSVSRPATAAGTSAGGGGTYDTSASASASARDHNYVRGDPGFSDALRHQRYTSQRYADLDSGLATMEIADAFLEGIVGRELLTVPEQDYRSSSSNVDPSDLSAAQAQRTATALLGIDKDGQDRYRDHHYEPGLLGTSRRPYSASAGGYSASFKMGGASNSGPVGGLGVGGGNKSGFTGGGGGGGSSGGNNSRSGGVGNTYADGTYRNSSAAASYLQYGQRSAGEKRMERALDDEAKRRYEAPGWRQRGHSGGWVADFGPGHTRAFYTGPESHHRLTVQDKPWLRSSAALVEEHRRQQQQLFTQHEQEGEEEERGFQSTTMRHSADITGNRSDNRGDGGSGGHSSRGAGSSGGDGVGVSDEMLLNINRDIDIDGVEISSNRRHVYEGLASACEDASRSVHAAGRFERAAGGRGGAVGGGIDSESNSYSVDTAVAGAGEGYVGVATTTTNTTTNRTTRSSSARSSRVHEVREEDAFKAAQDDAFLATLQDSVALSSAASGTGY